MDLRDLFLNCRKGDVERVKYLVEQKEVEVNSRDKWDSSPLYYACLCGHLELVKFLLENGARCEANTFDGERCLYGALNPEIRNVLKNFKVVSKQTIRREPYHEFLRKLLESGEHADICFVVHGEAFYAHRCILSARSEYFEDMLADKWRNRTVVHINHELVNPTAFRAVLQYIYTSQLETQLEACDDIARLAKQCKLVMLHERLQDMVKKAKFFQSTKPGTHVTSVLVEPPSGNCELPNDLSLLAEQALPPAFCRWIGGAELPFFPEERAPYSDVVFVVENHKFYCHQAFFCARSEYFKTLVRDPLGEKQKEDQFEYESTLPTVHLRHFTSHVFLHILYYVYQESVELDVNTVYEVLVAADLALLPGLKRLCGSYLAQNLDPDNVVAVLQTARFFNLSRLEDQCYQFMAENLEEILDDAEFSELVKEDAKQVTERQDVDSIDVIDNIRYHLTASTMYEAHDKLTMIDTLLEYLALDA